MLEKAFEREKERRERRRVKQASFVIDS